MREHRTDHRVRYDECDPMGLVHHSIYLQYFEIGRTELLRASGGRYREMEATGQFVVVVRVDCRYRRPARYDDLIEIETRIAKVTVGKIVHDYQITRDGECLVEATVTLAVIDRDGRPQRVPESLLQKYGDVIVTPEFWRIRLRQIRVSRNHHGTHTFLRRRDSIFPYQSMTLRRHPVMPAAFASDSEPAIAWRDRTERPPRHRWSDGHSYRAPPPGYGQHGRRGGERHAGTRTDNPLEIWIAGWSYENNSRESGSLVLSGLIEPAPRATANIAGTRFQFRGHDRTSGLLVRPRGRRTWW